MIFPVEWEFISSPTRPSNGEQFAADVKQGLSQRQKALSPKYFYDSVGSALFDAITELPEYGLTAADQRLLQSHATDIAERMNGKVAVAELGSGSGKKTRPVLEAIVERQHQTSYWPIDVSRAALDRCVQEFSSLPGVHVDPIEGEYLEGLALAVLQAREENAALILMFSGSSIGNLDFEERLSFLRRIRKVLRRSDFLLLGADLVKAPEVLLAAYDDPVGVTAAFNKNLLARINRELDGNFDLRNFQHEARWSAAHQRIEMHLRSLDGCRISIPSAEYEGAMSSGETIWTESSYKFTPEGLTQLAESAGFTEIAQWVDAEWPFAESLWVCTDN